MKNIAFKYWLEIRFWRVAQHLILKGYGPFCEVKDNVDFPELPKELNANNRCGACAAKEVYDWIEEHIGLLKD